MGNREAEKEEEEEEEEKKKFLIEIINNMGYKFITEYKT